MKSFKTICKKALLILMGGLLCCSICSADDSRPHKLDGPIMINPNIRKHQTLNGDWVTPQGNANLKISDFDFTFGLYQDKEPDHFAYYTSRFWFGHDDNNFKEPKIVMELSGPNIIKCQDGKVAGELFSMYYANKTIYASVQFEGEPEKRTLQLRRFETIRE